MQRILIILLLSIPPAASFAQTEEIVTLKTSTGDLEGTLLTPKTDVPVTVGLLIAGSGPTDRDGNNAVMKNDALKLLAEGLGKQGIATLRYDKRGIGKSAVAGVKEADLRFDHFVGDAADWIRLLQKDKRFNHVVVIGHSEGSLIGMIAAQQASADKFVSIAGAGQSADKTIREQLKAQPVFVAEVANPVLDKLAKGDTVQNVPPMLSALFRPSVQPYLISWFKYDPQTEIKKLKQPVLIIQGTTDIQIGVEDARKLSAANPDARLVLIDKMNHIFRHAEPDRTLNIQTYYQPGLPLKSELVEAIAEFIKN